MSGEITICQETEFSYVRKNYVMSGKFFVCPEKFATDIYTYIVVLPQKVATTVCFIQEESSVD